MEKSREIYPKGFIEGTLIKGIGDVLKTNTYLSFTLIAIGIEFIGKCHLTNHQDWEIKPDKAFKKGMELLVVQDSRYADIDIKDELRNGLAHTFLPKSKIVLSEVRNGAIHFGRDQGGKTVLVAEILFRDFVRICIHTLNTDFPTNDKMNKPFIRVGP
ncbi:MAG: hypothetical protein H6603_10295 [Flavobacteriales bacterium]|nr:hypothetical protein [Flavobacteriales bacterium]MCB9205354.1 hypothetical protein [Flavobacteriales bacterium]